MTEKSESGELAGAVATSGNGKKVRDVLDCAKKSRPLVRQLALTVNRKMERLTEGSGPGGRLEGDGWIF